MTRCLPLLALALLLLGACTEGSTTTPRPAVDRPVIGPEGTFWDAVAAAQLNEPRRLRYALSVRFLHRSILPKYDRYDTRDDAEYQREKMRQLDQLKGFDRKIDELYAGYAAWLGARVANRFVETEAPVFQIKFKDRFGAARGPNTARLKVNFHDRKNAALPPESMEVLFVQEGESWRIEGFTPDPLFGTFTP